MALAEHSPPIPTQQESFVSLASSLSSAAARRPTKLAVCGGGRSLTYAELDVEARLFARQLMACGAGPGDRIAVHMHNGAEIAVAYFACFHAGAIAVPMNTKMKGPEIQYILEHSGSSIYVGQRELFAEVERIRPSLPGVRRFIVDRHALDVCSDRLAATVLTPVQVDAPAVILYTSGSTARPKGVVHTHRSSLNAARGLGITGDDVVISVTSMAHSAAFMLLLASVAAAASTAVASPVEPDVILDAITRRRGTYILGMPFLYRALIAAQEARPRDVSSVTRYLAGGDAVPPALQADFLRRFGRPLHEIFGATETGLVAANWTGEANRVGSFGRPAPGVDIAVIDPKGAPVRLGAEGEMIVRSAANMIGYWNDAAATAAALIDGWFHTGDLVCRDREGYLWFRGRRKEIIIRGDANVSPQEVEAILDQHAGVREAGVVGAPDATYGERVVAFVSRRPGRRVAARQLISFVASRLAAYKVPEEIIFLEELPKNTTGKVDRRALRVRYAAADGRYPSG
jgi:long-chain acyl-CoA synthetase